MAADEHTRQLDVPRSCSVVVLAVLVAACTPFGSSESPAFGDGGDPADVRSASDAASDAETGADATDAGGEKAFGCGDTGRGPSTVDAGSFCIDRTEVTQGQYAQFLASTGMGTDVSVQGLACAWNRTFVPTCNYSPTATTDLPVVCVDWCDAAAFCRWANKRLCGRIGGGPTPLAKVNEASSSQWFAACTNGGESTRLYPYGPSYEAGNCAGPGDSISAVASHGRCVGGLPGLFDMSGNANEWEDQCVAGGGGAASDACRVRSGSVNSTPYGMVCAAGSFTPRRDDNTSAALGFRCCADR